MASIPVLDPLGENSHPDPWDESNPHPDLADALSGLFRFGLVTDFMQAEKAAYRDPAIGLHQIALRLGVATDLTPAAVYAVRDVNDLADRACDVFDDDAAVRVLGAAAALIRKALDRNDGKGGDVR